MDILYRGLKSIGIEPTEEMLEKFYGYMDGILEWNQKINLTRIEDREDFIYKHFIDSLICYNFQEVEKAKIVIDVGTGGGFPGIPLAIIFPEKHFILMDSLKKKLNVIDDLCLKLKINNVETLHGRAEDLARSKEHREAYDLCVARAVANLSVLYEYTLPFIKVGGNLLAYKGPEASKEVNDSGNALRILGGNLAQIKNVAIEGTDLNHNILIINKINKTPGNYPRQAGTPSKEPLK